jgi:hypothetical protein
MLWIGGRLSSLERLAMQSFVAHGHTLHLHTYGAVDGVPDGVLLQDARQVLPEASIFTYARGNGRGSPAAFANMFRYKLLHDRGGIWCDTDIVCLRPFTFALESPLWFASERLPPGAAAPPGASLPTCCYLQAPVGSPFMRECYEICANADKAALRWGETGPALVSRLVREKGLVQHVLYPDAICPLDWWKVPSFVNEPFVAPPQSFAVHLWNEMWRQKGLIKDAAHAPDGGYETLKRRYGVS